MLLSNSVVALATLVFASYASAVGVGANLPDDDGGCNGSGAKASPKTRKLVYEFEGGKNIEAVCKTLVGENGWEAENGDEKHAVHKACMYIDDDHYYFFQLGRIGSGARKIEQAECIDGLKKEVNCERGGFHRYANWYYEADYQSNATGNMDVQCNGLTRLTVKGP